MNLPFRSGAKATPKIMATVDGEYFSPGGDAFSVYPGEDGNPMESLRLLIFYDGLQDLRACRLCERLYGKEYVLNLIEEDTGPLTFQNYPRNATYLLKTREKINRAIAAAKTK